MYFNSPVHGSLLILDASTGNIVEHVNTDCNFAVRSPLDHFPPGLEHCEYIDPLTTSVGRAAVFLKRTFYYFTYELRLYGYDMDLRRWFVSECLANQLHPLKPEPIEPHCLILLLLGLPNGNLLLIVALEL